MLAAAKAYLLDGVATIAWHSTVVRLSDIAMQKTPSAYPGQYSQKTPML